MNICIVGDGLTALSLAKNLINKKINVYFYHKNKIENLSSSRTIGISKNNLEFFRKEIHKIPKKIFLFTIIFAPEAIRLKGINRAIKPKD